MLPKGGAEAQVKNKAKNVANKINDELRGAAYVEICRYRDALAARGRYKCGGCRRSRRGLPVSSGHTALMFASYAGRLDTIRILLIMGQIISDCE